MVGDRKIKVEDRILWGRVARSTRPLPGRMEELTAFETALEEALPAPAATGWKGGKDRQATLLAGTADSEAGARAAPRTPSGVHHPLERPVKRKLSRGRLKLEARIDLHDLIQSEAHHILLDFLHRAHDRGLRHVLVITGKGSSRGSEGALKRAVPMWFAKPEFRYLISSHEPAAAHHGGEGALYVRLSRKGGEDT